MKSIFRAFTVLTVSVLAGSALAGTEPVNPEPVCSVPFTGSVSVGYDSSYLFRGGRYGDHAPWSAVDLNYALNEKMTLNFGVFYINPTKGPFVVSDELDVYAFLIFPLTCPLTGEWEVGVGGSWLYFPEDSFDEGELQLTLTKSIGNLVDFTFDYVYDVTFEGSYFGYALSKDIELTSCLDLNLGAGISHADDNYNFDVLGGDNAYVSSGFTLHLTDSADFAAYVLGNFPYGELEEAGEESDVYGGASLTVSF